MPEPLKLDLNLNPQEEIPQNNQDSLTEGFLQKIPDEQHRAIIAPYVKTWDQDVNAKFREYNERLKPYEDLGPIEDVTKALSFIGAINEDPVTFYNELYNMLKDEGMLPELENEEKEVPSGPVGPDNLPPEYKTLFESMQTQLDELKGFTQESKQAQEDAENKKVLDDILEKMHTDFGEFDDEFMTFKFAAGKTPEQAMKDWKDLESRVNKGNTTPKQAPPKVFTGGSGAVPQEQGKLTFKTDAERKAYVVQALQAASGD